MAIRNKAEPDAPPEVEFQEELGLQAVHEDGDQLGMMFLNSPAMLNRVQGCTVELDETGSKGMLCKLRAPQATEPKLERRSTESEPHIPEEDSMANQDRYIDARLDGIETKLDSNLGRMRERQDADAAWTKDVIERIEKQSEKAEDRFEKASQGLSQQYHDLRSTIDTRFEESRRHSTVVALSTVGGVFAGFAIVIAIAVGWISEQGSYAKSYGETQVEIQQAADERAEFREAVQSIQATQQSILERLPERTAE